jgi:hypothetical protein
MYCNNCKQEKTIFIKEFQEKICLGDKSRNLMKSVEKILGKPKKEIEQYIGNKDKDVISEFERIRGNNKTIVIHRLWRRFGSVFKISRYAYS